MLGEDEPVSFLLQTLFSQMEMVLFTHIHKYSFTAWVNADFRVTALKSHPVLSPRSEIPFSPVFHRSTAKQHRCIKKLVQVVSKHSPFLLPLFRACSPASDPSDSIPEEEIAWLDHWMPFTHHSCTSWLTLQICSSEVGG